MQHWLELAVTRKHNNGSPVGSRRNRPRKYDRCFASTVPYTKSGGIRLPFSFSPALLPPAPKRKLTTSWKDFIRAHMAVLAATDFFTVEELTLKGLMTYALPNY
jgi:hypothetical protein